MSTLLFALLVACSSPPTLDTQQLSWMSGCWTTEHNGATVAECWAYDDDLLRGQGRIDDRIYENTVIGATGGELHYVVSKVDGPTTTFVATRASSSTLRFENPQHDNPKWIAYQKDGDGLLATMGNSSTPTAQFRFSPL